jgi:peptide/nickel transport system substrate-binding protein
MMYIVSLQLRNCLVEVDHTGQPIPELAESWESTSDASKWIFKLRKGVEFHDGKTLTAEDVVFSINGHRKEGSKSPAKVLVDSITDIKADGNDSVVITLREGNVDFAFLMSAYHLQIVPAGTTDFDRGIGTGGYKLARFEPGIRALTERNPNYWKEGRAHFDEVENLHMADVTARTNALRTGEIDVLSRPDSKTFHMLAETQGVQTLKTTGTKHYNLAMQTDVPPYDNNDVRLALKYAFDREAFVQKILRGHGEVGNDHPIAPVHRYFASELPQREYDPDKARHHMDKAGLSDHVFELYTSDAPFEGAVDAAVLYKENAAKAGINIDVKRVPADGYFSDVWMKQPFVVMSWFGRPTEDWMLSTVYAAGAAWNETNWKHDRFNELLVAARSESDEGKRRAMYVEIQTIIRDEGGEIIPAFVSDLLAANTKLKFDEVAGNFELDGLRLPERWWFGS